MPIPAFDPQRFAPPAVEVHASPDGVLRLQSPLPVPEVVPRVGDWLIHWAAERPEQTFLAERPPDGGAWREVSYAQALATVRRYAQGLLDRGLNAERPLMILSGNSVDHALLSLAALHVGVPVVPVSTAYSLVSQDHAKLRAIAHRVAPGLVVAESPQAFARAFAALNRPPVGLAALQGTQASSAVEAAFTQVGPDTVAKVLFTSGSTGEPKGVINTQRMLTVNQAQSLAVWRFVSDEPPVVLDWLPWSHTFGGNYNLNLVLSCGGTLYIDAGRPVPGGFHPTLDNLRTLSPTMYFNVPRGFEMLLPALEQDAALNRHFFARCGFVFYAAAALPQALWMRLAALARQAGREDLAIVSAWGATETAPLCCALHHRVDRAGVIGLPVPGLELKLLPNSGKLEARVRGPNVSPGYWRDPQATKAAFDEEGFYRMGDALRLLDPANPAAGLLFDGRVAEDFKLRSGTWVHVGAVRLALLAAADGLVQDAVITGHDRDEVGALLFLTPMAQALPLPELGQRLRRALQTLAAEGTGSAGRVERVRVLTSPPQVDAGEITDKGYLNQRALLTCRADEVLRLYALGAPDAVPDDGRTWRREPTPVTPTGEPR